MSMDFSEILYDIVTAAGRKDWNQVETQAEKLGAWARAARRELIDSGTKQHPGNDHKSHRDESGVQ